MNKDQFHAHLFEVIKDIFDFVKENPNFTKSDLQVLLQPYNERKFVTSTQEELLNKLEVSVTPLNDMFAEYLKYKHALESIQTTANLFHNLLTHGDFFI